MCGFTVAALALASVGAQESPVLFPSPVGQPEVVGDRVYVGTEDGTVYAYNKSTGRQLWSFKKEREARNRPLYNEGLVMIGGFDGILHALDAETGKVVWAFKSGEVEWKYRDKFINGVPTVVGENIVFSSEDYNVYCVAAKTGKEVWRRKLAEEPQALALPIVDGNALVGTWDGNLYAIDAKSGEIMWRSKTDFMPAGQTKWTGTDNAYFRAPGEEKWLKSKQAPHLTAVPAYDAERIYVSRWSGELIALDRKTGVQLWRFAPDTKDTFEAGSRLFVDHFNGVVTFGTSEDGHIYGVDAKTGKELWSKNRGGPIFGPFPVGKGMTVYAEHGSAGLKVFAVEIASGKELFALDGMMYLPAIIGDTAYVASMAEGGGFILIGIDIQTGKRTWTLSKRP